MYIAVKSNCIKRVCCQNLTKNNAHNNDVNVNDYYNDNDDGNNNNNDIKTRHLWQTMKINNKQNTFFSKALEKRKE